MSTFICPHCGGTHRPSARFCPATGKLIQREATPLDQQPETPALTGRLPANSMLNNRYLILRKVGHGGMAAVYQAADTQQPGTMWAIKEMSDAALSNVQERDYAMRAFQQEAHLLRSLVHPNLPRVIDAFTQGGKHYLVMEFVPGETLQVLLERRAGPFSEAEVLPWALQLCDVLDYLHNQEPKIIFRDIKPSNIMLTPQEKIKLIDFGIARFFKPGKSKDTLALGTPGFAAPEAVSGQTDERSDIYSLCATLHHLLTGHDPIKAMFNIPPARQLNPAITENMDRILMRGLQNERDLRWRSAADMRSECACLASIAAARQERFMAQEMVTPAAKKVTTPSRGNRVAPTVASGSAPVVIRPASAGKPIPASGQMPPPASTSAPQTSRPTMRLVMAAAQLSAKQIALLALGLLVGIIILTWLLAPVLDSMPIDWNRVPVIALFGALGFAAYPKRGVAFTSHALLSTVLVATIWTTLGSQGYEWLDLFLAAFLSGALMEIWVAFLPRIKGDEAEDAWLREAGWLGAMALIGTTLFIGLSTEWATGLHPEQWFLSFAFGVAGWFAGDLLQQTMLYKRTGLKRR
jgi:serine/threonine protein kinase